MLPSLSLLILNIHLQPTRLAADGIFTYRHVCAFVSELSSLRIAVSQLMRSGAHYLRVCQRVVVDDLRWLLSDVYASIEVLLSRSASQLSLVGLQHCVSHRYSRRTVAGCRYEVVAQLSHYLQLRSVEVSRLRLRFLLGLSLRLLLRLWLRLRLINVTSSSSSARSIGSMSAAGWS